MEIEQGESADAKKKTACEKLTGGECITTELSPICVYDGSSADVSCVCVWLFYGVFSSFRTA